MKEKIKLAYKNPLLSGSLLMIGGSMFANVINYLYHLLMGRVLGPVDYGTLSSIFAILYILSVIPTSASFAVVKFISSADTDSEVSSIFKKLKTFVFWLSIVLSSILLIGSPVIAKFLRIDNVLNVSIISPILILSLMTLIYQSTLQGLLIFWGVVGPGILASIVKLSFGITFVLLGWRVFGAVLGIFIAYILSYIYVIRLSKKIPNTKKTQEFHLKKFFKYSIPVLIQASAFTSLFTIDLVLVKHFLSPFEAGLYAALSTLGKIIYFAAQPITSVMFPIVSKKRSLGENYRKVFYASFALTLLASGGVVVIYYLFPNLAIGVLYGEKYLSASRELVWMGIFISMYTTSYFLANFLLSLGYVKTVILPSLTAITQIIGIMFWHENLLQVIQVSLICISFLLTTLLVYLFYNRVQKIYVSR